MNFKSLAAAMLMCLPMLAWSDVSDDKARTEASDPDFITGRLAMDKKDWPAALAAFNKAAARDPGDADVQNYLGYSNRKLGKMDEAFKHYDRALKLNPKHLGAHEYVGEAYLMVGKPEKAREHLATLQKLCKNCEEYQDLQKALTAYEKKPR